MQLGQSGAIDQSTAPKAGRLLGAENLVVGNLSDPAGKVGVASTTASTTRGGVVGSFSLSEAKDKFYELQKQVVANIIKVNNIKMDKETEDAVLKKYHTRSYQAVAYYGQGLDAQDRGDSQASMDYFALAVREDPNFGLASKAHAGSPGGLSAGLTGPVSGVALSAIEGAVSAQKGSDGSGVGKTSTGGKSGGGGGGGHCS